MCTHTAPTRGYIARFLAPGACYESSLLVFVVLPLLSGDAKFNIKPLREVASLADLVAGPQWPNGPSAAEVPDGKIRRLRLVQDVCGEADAQYAGWTVMADRTDTADSTWRALGIQPAKHGHRPLHDWIHDPPPEEGVRVMWAKRGSCSVANTWNQTNPKAKSLPQGSRPSNSRPAWWGAGGGGWLAGWLLG